MQSRLEIALKARIPLISTTTRDPSSIARVLKMIGRTDTPPVHHWEGSIEEVNKFGVVVYVGNPFGGTNGQKAKTEMTPEKAFNSFKHMEAVLVVVNAEKLSPLFYEAGEAPCPEKLMLEMIQTAVQDEEKAKELQPAMGGMTLLEGEWCMRMTAARKAPLTRPGLTATRKKYFPPRQGLEQVDTEHLVYQAPQVLDTWLGKQKPFILDKVDPSLRPKGILFNGPPGTGKTAGAKHVARTLGLPLYRFDASEVKSKWVGESESNLTRTLEAAAHESPCVLLMDEVEKLFSYSNIGDTSGVTKSLLGQFLWFLQESEARVTFVMTTNDQNAIPQELIRPGRIDTKMHFAGLTKDEIPDFAALILGRYKMESDQAFKVLTVGLQQSAGSDHMPQASVENAVIQYVKDRIIASKTKG